MSGWQPLRMARPGAVDYELCLVLAETAIFPPELEPWTSGVLTRIARPGR